MNDTKITGLYQEIGNILNSIIPTRWNKILLSAEVYSGAVSYHYCFYDANSGELIEFGYIEKKYKVNLNELKLKGLELTKIIEKINDEFANNNQERWSTMTFILHNDGKFSIDYGYEDLFASGIMDRRRKWEKKYLNI